MVLSANPIITEFVASNDSSLLDGNGSSSDWIEIFNAGDESVDLDDYTLIDNASNPASWEFPSRVLGAGEYLVVFASGDGVPDPVGNLHTDFGLSAGGEYLGLFDPEGLLLSEFDAGGADYPPQITDVSYGREFSEDETTLVLIGETTDYLIPNAVTGPAVGPAWVQPGYTLGSNGESWQSGPTGFGYDLDSDYDTAIATDVQSQLFGQGTSAYLRSTFTKLPGQAIDTLRLNAQYDDGFVAYLNGTEVLRANGPVGGNVAGGSVALGNLFDDPKGTSLDVAIASDTYQAEGEPSDLGVYTVIDGSLNVGQTIAPGVNFDLSSIGGGSASAGSPSNDTYRSNSNVAIRTTGSSSVPSTKVEDGIGMHANGLITFDLGELRAAGGFLGTNGYFTARAGLNDTAAPGGGSLRTIAILSDSAGNVLVGYVNGQAVEVVNTGGVWSFTGTFPSSVNSTANRRFAQFAFGVPEEASYLTLAATSSGSIGSDHAVFSGATLDFNSIPLGNLFDDAKGTVLSAAIDSNTMGALGDVGDLGVYTVQDGEFQTTQTIAPSVSFDLSNVGTSTEGDGVGPGNDTVNDQVEQPIRTRGVSFTSLDEIAVEDGIGMSADELITFNLNEIRTSGGLGAGSEFRFRARAALSDWQPNGGSGLAIAIASDASGGVLGAWVNGQATPVANNGGVWSLDFSGGVPAELDASSGAADIDIDLGTDAAYLTLVSGGVNTGDFDELVFSGARLMVLPSQSDAIAWDASAGGTRDDASAIQFEQFDLSEFTNLLQEGDNVLAIQALNEAATDRDFLFSHELVGGGITYDNNSGRYFTIPTPGQPNDGSPADVAPIVREVTDSPFLTDSDDLLVQATLFETVSPVEDVTLYYRVMFGAEVALPMVDDGSIVGDVAGDGVYTAVIPASASGEGDMVRWRVTAEDSAERFTKAPAFDDPTKSPEYFGTMVQDPSVDTELPTIYWFTDNLSGATGGGARGSVYYNGEFYENLFMRRRGQSSNNDPKKNLKFDFNPDHRFRLDPESQRVDEINLNNTYYDKSDVRATLAAGVLEGAGVPTPETFPIRTQYNGEFWSLAVFVEQPGEEFLERNGLDADGALYKVTGNNGLVSLSGIEKKTRKDEDFSDIQELIDGVNPSRPQAERAQYLYDNVDIPSVINYIAGMSIIHNNDHVHKNNYLYRDSNGTREWRFLPWDLDLTFGKNGANTASPGNVESLQADEIPGGHPFFGDSDHRRFNAASIWNRLIDAVLDTPELREMYLRRLRSVMDEVLQSPDTSPGDLKLEARLDELLPQVLPVYALDDANWIEAPQQDPNAGLDWGFDFTLAENFERIKDLYLAPRRVHLFETHNIANLPAVGATTLIEARASGKYFVPTSNSLETSWADLGFNDSGWTNATLGIGYETSGTNFAPLIETNVRPQDTPGGATSVFTRVPFTVDDVGVDAPLNLQVRYDDGFVAYLNGTEVARRNVSGTPTYNGSATSHPDGDAVIFEPIDISQHAGLLNLGSNNVLAIHSMNSSTGSSDQLIMVELVYGGVDTNDIAGIPDRQVVNLPIQIDPVDLDANPLSGNQGEEYLRLNNPNATAIDISGWRLRGGIDRLFPPGTVIPANGSLYAVADAVAFRARANGPSGGQNLLVSGEYGGNLSSQSETVELISADGTLIDTLITPDNSTPNQRFLRLTEINYNPPGSEDATEYLELTNISSGGVATTLDLTGVSITDGPSTPFVFAPGTTLAAGESVLVVKDQAAFLSAYPGVSVAQIAGEFAGGLSNGGEDIVIDDADGNTLVEIDYLDRDLWTRIADGAGGSLELIDPAGTPRQQLGKPQSWRGSTAVGGTPAATNSQPLGVVINEVLTHTDAPLSDAIELRNVTGATINVGGWYLSDSDDDLQKFQIPLGTIIAAGGYMVFDESDFNPTPTNQGPNDFALDSTNGDQVWLTKPNGEFADQVEFGPTLNGESLGRLPDGTGRLTPQSRRTLGATNRAHRNGPLVITEVQYNPGSPNSTAIAVDPSLTDDDLEFVEVHNPTSFMVSLDDWALAGEVPFTFDPGSTLAPGATLLVLPFNPTSTDNALRLQAFRAHYQIDPSVAVVGGFSGRLNNGYGRVELTRPDSAPELPSGFTPITSDEVVYDDFAPWPISADGFGGSLQRVSATTYGNNSASWSGDTPTPGTVAAGVTGDFNGDGLVTPADLAQLVDAIDGGSPLTAYDLNGVDGLTQADVNYLIDVIVAPIAGDYDWDGDVDQDDRTTWATVYGSSLALNADGNQDGVVDAADYTIWRDNLGSVTAAASSIEIIEITGEVAPAQPTVTSDLPRTATTTRAFEFFGLPGDNTHHPSSRPIARDQQTTAGDFTAALMLLQQPTPEVSSADGEAEANLVDEREHRSQDTEAIDVALVGLTDAF